MKSLLGLLLFITLTVLIFFIAWDYYVKIRASRFARKKFRIVSRAISKINEQTHEAEKELHALAEDPSYRLPVYYALTDIGQLPVFPEKFRSEAMAAEAYMVNWLEFPTELGKAPEQIYFVDRVSPLEDEHVYYYVFKFILRSPWWVAKSGWMLGVCGPYEPGGQPFEIPRRIFSRYNSVSESKPEEEVQWVHEHIS